MADTIQIKTGARISNILQSTVTYEQAFTELVKNSMQSGATFVDITLNADSVVVIDNGIGFDHEADENGMTGFEKYFVFGNSYDMSNQNLHWVIWELGEKLPTINYQIPTTHYGRLKPKIKKENLFGNIYQIKLSFLMIMNSVSLSYQNQM